MVQLLKAGKGKEVSYNALATHIIAEDGDNPEVGESREVFDLPVVKVRLVLEWLRLCVFINFVFLNLSLQCYTDSFCIWIGYYLFWVKRGPKLRKNVFNRNIMVL